MRSSFRLFVIGASAGGNTALTHALSNISADINAAFIVVVHSTYQATSSLAQNLENKIDLKVIEASNNLSIDSGAVYISVPGCHLVVNNGKLNLSYGPRENLCRPSIDTLFRSAAVAYSHQCVGVLLSGRLNDGTVGLESIKACGGLTIIQNPETAEYKGMPLYAQEHMDVDYTLELEEMSKAFENIAYSELPQATEVPAYLIKENAIASNLNSDINITDALGDQTPVSCPECNGPLWKLDHFNTTRYRCHMGHSFSEEALIEGKNGGVEKALWVALRILEEKKVLMLKIIEDYKKRNANSLILSYQDKLDEIVKHIDQLRKVMNIEKP